MMRYIGYAVVGLIGVFSYAQNVGVGTTTPQHKLDVAGDARVQKELIVGDSITFGGPLRPGGNPGQPGQVSGRRRTASMAKRPLNL